jgi:hypothetical protein
MTVRPATRRIRFEFGGDVFDGLRHNRDDIHSTSLSGPTGQGAGGGVECAWRDKKVFRALDAISWFALRGVA